MALKLLQPSLRPLGQFDLVNSTANDAMTGGEVVVLGAGTTASTSELQAKDVANDKSKDFICNMHPHNYYLEILTETGIFGLGIISLTFLIVIYNSIIKKYFLKPYQKDSNLLIPFMFLLLVEVFPIKSSGSFFTTGNATYLYLIIAITIGLSIKYKYIEKK